MAAVALLLVATIGQVDAQAKAVSFGVEAGAGISTITGSDSDGAKSRTSPFFGITAVVQPVGGTFGFQSGLQLVGKGASTDEEGISGSVRLRYLEVPLLLRIAPTLAGSKLKPALLVGGALGLRVSCSVSAEGGGISANVDCDDSLLGGEAEVKRFDAGLAIGAELGIPFRERFLLVPMVRYTRGLMNVGDSASSGNDVKNGIFQVGVGLRFR
jgi:hypothetical protein